MIGKVLGPGGGTTEILIKAINWAVQGGANVISMSLGIDFPGYVKYLQDLGYPAEAATSMALEGYRENLQLYGSLANFIRQQGMFMNPCLIVGASGNESQRPNYEIASAPPAVADGLISVGATDQNSQIAPFSNNNPDLCAPGVSIKSVALDDGLTQMSGTSMATPHVAGVAALWTQKLKQQNQLNSGVLRTSLLSGVSKVGISNYNLLNFGSGIVQAPVV